MKKNIAKIFAGILVVLFSVGTVPPLAGHAAALKAYYVDPVNGNDGRNGTAGRPLKTIEKTLDKAKEYFAANAGAEITIYLKGGMYQLTGTLEINEQSINGGSLKVQAVDGERPVLSGGRTISGWTLYDAEKNIYSAPLAGSNPRQLYVNGKRAVRARTPDRYLAESFSLSLSDEKYTGYTCTSREPLSWTNTGDIEFVYSSEWANHRCKISSVTARQNGSAIRMADGFHGLCTVSWGTGVTEDTSYYLENAYEFLDSDGEFYVDPARELIFYKPVGDEDMNTAEAIYPAVTTLVRLRNKVVGQRVSNITFENIAFMHADWQRHNEIDTFFDNQNNLDIYGNRAAAAVLAEGAENIIFRNCTIANTGGDAIQFINGIRSCVLDNCEIYNTAAGAVTFGEVSEADILGTDADMLVDSNAIENCTIYNTGLDYRGAAAVTLGAVSNMRVHHNEIFNTSYSGLHIGWGWNDYADKTVVTKNISVKYNYLHDILNTTIRDGGAVYTLGKNMGGCVTAYNYVKNQYQKASCLYNDEGTNDWATHHNVVDNSQVTTWTPRWMHWHTDTILRCHMYDNYADSDVDYRNSPTSIMERLTIVSDGSWPAEAIEIMNHAGPGKTDIYRKEAFYGKDENDGEELLITGNFDQPAALSDGWIFNPVNAYSLERSFENTCGGSGGSLKANVSSGGEILERTVCLRRNSFYHFSLYAKPCGTETEAVIIIPYLKYNGAKQYFDHQQAACGKWTQIQAYFQPPVAQERIDYAADSLYDTYTVGFELIQDTAGSGDIVYFDDVTLSPYLAYYNPNFQNGFEGWNRVGGISAALVDFDPASEGVLQLIETGDFPDVSKVALFSSDGAGKAGVGQNFAFEKNTVYDVSYWIKAGEPGKKLASIALPLGRNAAFAEAWPYAIWAKTDISHTGWTHIQYQIAFGDTDKAQAFDSIIELRYANSADAGENAVPGSFYMAEFKVEKTKNLIGNPYFLFGSAATRSADDKDWSQNTASAAQWESNAAFSALNNQEAITYDGAKACGRFVPAADNAVLSQRIRVNEAGSYRLMAWVKTTGDAVFVNGGQEIVPAAAEYNGWKKLSAEYYFQKPGIYDVGIEFQADGECLFKDFSAIPLDTAPRFENLSILNTENEIIADRDGIYTDVLPDGIIKIRGKLKNADGAALVIAGYTAGNTLASIRINALAQTGDFEKTVDLGAGSGFSALKLFVWDTLAGMGPIDNALVIQ